MKDKVSYTDNVQRKRFSVDDSISEIQLLEAENRRLKAQISNLQTTNDTWNNSVMQVVFKNEVIARKYKPRVEAFLKNLLEDGDNFMSYCAMHENTEQEFEDVHQSFHIDKLNSDFHHENKVSKSVPVYNSAFDDVLHCDPPDDGKEKKGEEKPQKLTCFNCLGDHHLKQCPEKFDRARISANKKDILSVNSNRYHQDEQNRSLKPGYLSSELKNALGLKANQLPQYIYHMRVIGYPPGWMKEAVLESSGLSLYDVDGKVDTEESSSKEKHTLYDGTKFINYPGFNSPVPGGFLDEWKTLKMPSIQLHQQLSEALKSPNTITSNVTHKRKQLPPNCSGELKKSKNGVDDPNNLCSNLADDTPRRQTPEFHFTPNTPEKRHSMSVSITPGTPILEQSNPYQKLPEATKFAQGITEHLPFENLPDAVGKYEKMRGVLTCVQKKLYDLNCES